MANPKGEQYSCEVHKSVILAHLLEALTVYSFPNVANQKMKNFIEFSLSSNCKTAYWVDLFVRNKNISVKILSMSIIEGGTEL